MAAESKDDVVPAGVVDDAIAAAVAVAKTGDLTGALDKLYAAEKKSRMAGDALATAKLAVQVVRLCHEAGDWKALNANVLVLSKKRGQSKQAITEAVQEAMKYLDGMSNKEDKMELITTLRAVTEGKMYVEMERARLTRALATLYEAEGRIAQASEVLQEVHVETSSVMEIREKAEFILEQVRLTQLQGDYVRMAIIANKVNKRVLDDAGMEDLKLKHYNLQVALHQQQHDALALCKDHQAIYGTRGFETDPSKWIPALQSAIVYCALTPWSNEVSDLLHKMKQDKRTEELPSYRALLHLLTTDEIVPWPLPAPHHDTIMAHDAFTTAKPGASATAMASGAGREDEEMGGGVRVGGGRGVTTALVSKDDEDRVGWAPILHKRVVQHNVRVVSKWYSRIRFSRLAELLGLDLATAESAVSELAADKVVYAKIDRPAGTVSFARPRPATEVLSDYAADIDTVLGLVEKTRHLIEKEYMVHGITAAPTPGIRA